MKVRVWVPFCTQVPYIVEVEKFDLEEIVDKLEEKDPSDWVYDPNFYEQFGSNWRANIEKVEKDDVEEVLDGE